MVILEKIYNFQIKHPFLSVAIFFIIELISLILFNKYDNNYELQEYLVKNGSMLLLNLIGIPLYFSGFKYWRRKRMIENIPGSKISSLALGFVELSGTAEYGNTALKSPYTKSDCVLYKYSDQRKKGEYSKTPFYIQDNTGLILVDPTGAEFALGEPIYDHAGITEWIVEAGKKLYILGTVQKNKQLLQNYKDKLVRKLVECKTNPEVMLQIDTNKNGKISTEEWDEAANKIKDNLAMAELNQVVDSPTYRLVVSKGEADTLYIISSRTEEELCRHLITKTNIRIIGGSVVALISAAYIIFGMIEVMLIAVIVFIIICLIFLKVNIDLYDI
ncbi:MAG: hypothetical protein PHD29_00405 [bacterium]|nr:hypothetical protein [bacterium]MDD5756700.1 hypothetical protein [bacterium]